MRTRLLGNRSGFNLIELMSVVAITGILSTIAIGNYQGMQSKARMAEAKVMLGALLKSEMAFALEESSFTVCVNAVGFGIDLAQSRYYSVGFKNSVVAAGIACGPTLTETCNQPSYTDAVATTCAPAATSYAIRGNRSVSSNPGLAIAPDITSPGITAGMLGGSSAIAGNAFRAIAAGYITDRGAAATPPLDTWAIDNAGQLVHLQAGL